MKRKREVIASFHWKGKSNTPIAQCLCVTRSNVWKAVKLLMKKRAFVTVEKW